MDLEDDLHRLQRSIVGTEIDNVDLEYVQTELCGSNIDEECEVEMAETATWRSAFAVVKPSQAALDDCDSEDGCGNSAFVSKCDEFFIKNEDFN